MAATQRTIKAKRRTRVIARPNTSSIALAVYVPMPGKLSRLCPEEGQTAMLRRFADADQ
jgi:hypothetical protein